MYSSTGLRLEILRVDHSGLKGFWSKKFHGSAKAVKEDSKGCMKKSSAFSVNVQ